MKYMKVEDVLIRTISYLVSKDEALIDMFLDSTDREIPIYYEYSQKAQAKMEMNPNDIIGYATNFHIVDTDNSSDGNYMAADVYINPLHPATHNFTNTLDNYGVSFKDGAYYELIRFTIYNKAFKEKVDAANLEKAKKNIEISNLDRLEENNDLQS